jgi:hypothetical protein
VLVVAFLTKGNVQTTAGAATQVLVAASLTRSGAAQTTATGAATQVSASVALNLYTFPFERQNAGIPAIPAAEVVLKPA